MEALDEFKVEGLRIRIFPDEDGSFSDPRQNDNLSVIYGDHRSYQIGDGKPPFDEEDALNRGGIRLLYRYLRMSKKIVAFTKLGMLDHSGLTFYPVAMGQKGDHWVDPGGWDSGIVGYAYITAARWKELMGDEDPKAEKDSEEQLPLGKIPVKREAAMAALLSEIDEYGKWASGEVYGYVIDKPTNHECDFSSCPHDFDMLDSCWGFIGNDYVKEAATEAAKGLAQPVQ